MQLSETCIRRPVTTTLLTAAIIALGVFGFRLLPVSALPKVEYPTISVTATLPGASPDTMAASVAGPIERQLSTIPGISSMTSRSATGSANVTIQFDLNRDIDAAALDVQTALTIAQRRLPVEMTTPPSFRKVNPGDFPILFIALSSATMSPSQLNEYADSVFVQTLSQIPGVAQVNVFGSQKFAVRIQADPEAAAARGLSLEDIRLAVARANSSTPVGTMNGPDQAIALNASGQLAKAEDYNSVVVAWRNGAPVKLNEVARIYDSVENDRNVGWFNGQRALVLAILKQSDANTVAVVDAVRARIPQLQEQIPSSISLDVTMDSSISIRQAVWDVEETLLIAVALVIMVIFLFLRSATATFIPAVAVPVSLVGTCGAMYLLGFSINNMTLLALTLSVGFVVDDAIVMLENITRHIENGMRPFEAALKGAREIGFTIISITFSLIAVFIPVLLMARHRRPPVPRIRDHGRGRDRRVGLRVADADADAVRAHAERPRSASPAELRAAQLRMDVRQVAQGLRARARLGAALQVHHADGDDRHTRRHRRALRLRAEEPVPRRRHRLPPGADRSRDRYVLRRDGRAPGEGQRDRRQRSGGGLLQRVGRRRRPEQHPEHRRHVHRAQAEERARADPRGDEPPQRQDRRGRRCHADLPCAARISISARRAAASISS